MTKHGSGLRSKWPIRNTHLIFSLCLRMQGKRPNTVITDGARNFHDAFTKEFFTINNPRTRHISHIRLQGDHNNNKMERLNGEVRDREKTMRGMKIQNTAEFKDERFFPTSSIKRAYFLLMTF